MLQGVRGSYKESEGVTRSQREAQGVRGRHKESEEGTRSQREAQGVTLVRDKDSLTHVITHVLAGL